MESNQSTKIPSGMPPHDPEMEMHVLGCMMKNDAQAAAYIFDKLDQSCFYQPKHKIIFEAGKELFKNQAPTDCFTIWNKLKNENKLDDNVNLEYLTELDNFYPSASNYEHDCKMVLDAARARKAILLLDNFKKTCYDLSTPPDINAIQKQLDEIALDRVGVGTVPPLPDRLRDKRDRDKDREPGKLLGYRLTRFYEIAQQIDGVQPGFYVFAGITSVGKTAFLTNIFYDLLDANQDLHGIYFSLDDNENVIFNRLLATICNGELQINQLQKRVDNDKKRGILEDAYNRLIELAESGRFDIMDFGQIQTIENIESVIRAKVRDGRKVFVVIDGLQNIELGKEYTGLRQKNVDLATNVKRLVDIYQIPLFTSVEIRKRQQGEPARMPGIDDIMETGKYGYNANHIWIAHPERDWENFENMASEYRLTVATKKSKIAGPGKSIEIVVKRFYNQLIPEHSQPQEEGQYIPPKK